MISELFLYNPKCRFLGFQEVSVQVTSVKGMTVKEACRWCTTVFKRILLLLKLVLRSPLVFIRWLLVSPPAPQTSFKPLCSPDCPGTHSVAQTGLALTQIHLPLAPECWDSRRALPPPELPVLFH